jgi:hypothetical protein
LKEQETVDGKAAHVIEGKSREGSVDVLYLDAKTHLLVQLKTEMAVEGQGQITVLSKPSDYREVDGLKLPHLITVEAGPGGSFKLTVKEIKHGIELDDKLFVKPTP